MVNMPRKRPTKGSIASPSVKPKEGGGPGIHRNGGPNAQDREQLDHTLPELGAPRPLTESQWFFTEVFAADDAQLDTAVPISDSLGPSCQEGNVHALGGHNAKAALVSWFAYVRPADHMILLLIAIASLEEMSVNDVDLMVGVSGRL